MSNTDDRYNVFMSSQQYRNALERGLAAMQAAQFLKAGLAIDLLPILPPRRESEEPLVSPSVAAYLEGWYADQDSDR